MSTPELLTFGESMISLRAEGMIRLGSNFSSSVAGSESNVAIGLARLGHKVSWVGAVGLDEQAELILRTLRAEKVIVQEVVHELAPTGLMMVENKLGTNPLVSYYRSNSAGSKLSFEDVEPFLVSGLKVLHLTGITPALSESAKQAVLKAIHRARELGITVSFDVNYRSKLWSKQQATDVLGPIAGLADILIASEDELELVGSAEPNQIAKQLLQGQTHTVLIKRGVRGVSVITSELSLDIPAHKVLAVDTIGAGDAFCAGYLSGFLENLSAEQAARRGVLTAAFVVSYKGDWEGLPTRKDLDMGLLEPGEALR